MEEIATEMAVDPEELSLIMEANMDVESLEQVVYRGEGTQLTLLERLEDPADHQKKMLDHMLLDQLLAGLSQQEKHFLYMRYEQEYTQSYIATKLGISQVQVSRMEKRILQKIRKQQNLSCQV